jgi:hypothetical protein
MQPPPAWCGEARGMSAKGRKRHERMHERGGWFRLKWCYSTAFLCDTARETRCVSKRRYGICAVSKTHVAAGA